jgi:hypothetical protein
MSSDFVERTSVAVDEYRNTAAQVIKQADEESANVVPKTYSPEYIYRMTMLSIIGVLFIIYLTTSNEKLKKYSVLGLKIMVPLTILGYLVFLIIFLINR